MSAQAARALPHPARQTDCIDLDYPRWRKAFCLREKPGAAAPGMQKPFGLAGVFEAGGDAVDAFEDGVEEAGLVGGF